MSKPAGKRKSGGVSIGGSIGSVGGDLVGGDKIVGGDNMVDIPAAVALDDALRPVLAAIKAAPSQLKPEAEGKLASIKTEAAKGKDADDGVIAKLVDELVGLVPSATSALVSAFATPILGGLAGPVTSFVVDKLRGK
jgi:hypothetical protein